MVIALFLRKLLMKLYKHCCTFLIITIPLLFIFVGICPLSPVHKLEKAEEEIDQTSIKIPAYEVKTFTLHVKGLSSSQIDQHKTLYAGYVKKRNQIAQDLQTIQRTDVNNRTYSPFRSLKVAETFAHNGSVLHELYFENLGKQNESIGQNMQQLIKDNFGSLQAFKKDFFDCGGCARGWVVTCYCIDDGSIKNFVLEEHNTHVPMLVIPLLVLDVYEHAYMIDFGIKRDPYLDVFWNNIDWNVVEERIAKWVQPLIKEEQ